MSLIVESGLGYKNTLIDSGLILVLLIDKVFFQMILMIYQMVFFIFILYFILNNIKSVDVIGMVDLLLPRCLIFVPIVCVVEWL